MPLEPGTTLGSYSVTAKIGEGGMGEVYRARDTKLDRDVALKVLPQAFTSDPDRLARFEREAKVLASLNHPNIGHIYGLEEAEGTRALVLELIEGPTLADRITQGPIPLDEALPIAKQIAEALEAAHEQGVIHRDLKPANIKVRNDGMVKVLDFGLAKALAGDRPGADLSQSPTVTASVTGTRDGVILGTAAYMSPEQARGKLLDRRTDIWSFGCVLYETLTGHAAFLGETLSDTIAKILTRGPDWQALPTHTPVLVRRLLRRCLDKDPTDRLRDIGDARIEIGEAIAAPVTGDVGAVPAAPHAYGRRQALPLALGMLVVGSLITGLVLWSFGRPATAQVTRFTVSSLSDPGRFPDVVSPDGRTIVFANEDSPDQLYVRRLDELEAVPLRGAEGMIPFGFSPDGESVLVSDLSTLKKIPLTGGVAVTIANYLGTTDWGPGDTIVSGSNDGLWVGSASGGAFRQLLAPPRGESGLYLRPRFLPSGRAVLFSILGTGEPQVAVYDFDTGEQQILLSGSAPQFATSGHLVFYRDGSLWAVLFDPDRLEVMGEPRPVVEGVGAFGGGTFYSLAHDGTLIYRSDVGTTTQRTLVWVDRQGAEEPVGAEPLPYGALRLSPDGGQVALQVEGGEGSDILIYDLARNTSTRLTTDPASDGTPVWTPDGERIVFSSSREGVQRLFSKAADGTGSAVRLTAGTTQPSQAVNSMAPDGRTLVFVENASAAAGAGNRDVGILSMDGEQTTEMLLDTDFDEIYPEVSHDGRWMAYRSNESGQDEIYVRPFPNAADDKWTISRGGGSTPVWAADGRELFYRRPNGDMMVVPIDTEPTFSPGSPTLLFEARDFLVWQGSRSSSRSFDISPDGQRFLIVKAGGEAGSTTTGTPVVVVQNWFEELTRLVPVP